MEANFFFGNFVLIFIARIAMLLPSTKLQFHRLLKCLCAFDFFFFKIAAAPAVLLLLAAAVAALLL